MKAAISRITIVVLLWAVAFSVRGYAADVVESADRSLGRPRLLFALEDVSALRLKAQQGWMKDVSEALIAQAEQAIGKPILTYGGDGQEIGIQKQILSLAMAGYITGESRYTQEGIRILLSQVERTDIRKDLPKILNIGVTAHTYAVAYDWLAPFMTAEQRELVQKELREVGSFIWERNLTESWAADSDSTLSHNWTAVVYGGLGLAALSVEGQEQAWLDRSLAKVSGHLQRMTDAEGAPWESIGYINYSFTNAAPFIAAAERQKAGKLLPTTQPARLLPNYLTYALVPWGGGVVPINQMGAGQHNINFTDHGGLFLLTRSQNDEVGLWSLLRAMQLDRPRSDSTSYGVANAMNAYILLWGDPEMKAKSPQEAKLPLSRSFARGIVLMRGGWEDNDGLASFVSGPGLPGIWNHHDSNAFTFYANGDAFAIDVGSKGGSMWLSKHHNIVLVDGAGYEVQKGWHTCPGQLTRYEDNGTVVIAAGDARDAYPKPFSAANRTVLFARGKQPYLLILDDVSKDASPRQYSWQMHTDPLNQVAISEGRFQITGGRSGTSCVAHVISPTSADLSRAQEAGSPLTATSTQGNFVVLLTSSSKDASQPRVQVTRGADQIEVQIIFADGSIDHLTVRNATAVEHSRTEANPDSEILLP